MSHPGNPSRIPERFTGSELNFAEHALARTDATPAIVGVSQTREEARLSFSDLREATGRCRAGLERLGVRKGDRVAAYLPNIPETVAVFLATASLRAIWSSCAPEFGTKSVIDRFRQIEPKILLTVDGYRYGDRDVPKHEHVAAIRNALTTVQSLAAFERFARSRA